MLHFDMRVNIYLYIYMKEKSHQRPKIHEKKNELFESTLKEFRNGIFNKNQLCTLRQYLLEHKVS